MALKLQDASDRRFTNLQSITSFNGNYRARNLKTDIELKLLLRYYI